MVSHFCSSRQVFIHSVDAEGFVNNLKRFELLFLIQLMSFPVYTGASGAHLQVAEEGYGVNALHVLFTLCIGQILCDSAKCQCKYCEEKSGVFAHSDLNRRSIQQPPIFEMCDGGDDSTRVHPRPKWQSSFIHKRPL